MTLLPHTVADTALTRLFTDDAMADRVSWFSLPGGQVLCEAGETADDLFFVRTGRLAAIRHDEGQEPQFLGVIRPGDFSISSACFFPVERMVVSTSRIPLRS